jgi:hypothetical protein
MACKNAFYAQSGGVSAVINASGGLSVHRQIRLASGFGSLELDEPSV